MRSFAALTFFLGFGLAASAQPKAYSRAAPPDTASLERLDLKSDWSAYIPVLNRQDGIAKVQAVDAGQIFVQTRDGLLVALDAKTGREQWKYRFAAPFTEGFAVSVNEQHVYSVNVAKLYCHQRYTGVVEFEVDLPETPAVGPVADGDQLYVVFTGSKVVCYELPPSFRGSQKAKAELKDQQDKGITSLKDSMFERSTGRVYSPLNKGADQETFNVPKEYFDSGFGSNSNQKTYSVTMLQRVQPPFTLGGLNKVVSVGMLPSVRQPYTLRPEFMTGNQISPSVAAIPPSVARLHELSNLRPPPYTPKVRWIAELRGKVYAEPIFIPESANSAPRLWVSEDGRYLQSFLRERQESERYQSAWKLSSNAAAGLAGPYTYGKDKVLGFLPLADGQLLGFDLHGGTRENPRYEFRCNVGGPLNRLPIASADGVYVGGDHSGTARVNVQTGEVDWRTADDIDRVVAVTENRVIAKDRKGNLFLYAKGKADPRTFIAKPIGSLNTEDFGVNVANNATDRILLAADNGLIVCLREAGPKSATIKLIAPQPPVEKKADEKKPDEKAPAPKPEEPKPDEPKKP